MAIAKEIDRFLESPRLSEATRRSYRFDLDEFGAWLVARGLSLGDVDARTLSAYVADLAAARPGRTPRKLSEATRARKLSAVGIQNGTSEQGVAAFGAGLITLQGGRDVPMERGGRPLAAVAKPTEPTVASLVVTEPVRSGQRVFADRGDLVVVAAVGSGAELIAQGNIHVYGPLRGRALAGVNGDRAARIFCQCLEAELVAIAGLYRTSDDLGPSVRSQRVQAFLQDDALRVEPLK